LESIKKALKNTDTIVICSFEKYDDYECAKPEYTLCIGLLASKI